MSKALDTSDFDGKMAKLKRLEPEIIGRCLIKTMDQVKVDADEIPPKTPHDKGELRAVENVEIKLIDPTTVQIWYMMPYAARWHEAVNDIDPVTGRKITWKETGVGPKYLEKKFVDYAEKYGKLLAAHHKAELNNVS